MSGAVIADRPRVDADQVGAGAVVATRTLDDGAVVACLVEAGAAVWSLQDARTAADLAPNGPAWWERLT